MDDALTLLLESNDFFEIEILRDILKQENIPTIVKEPGMNHYLKIVLGDHALTLRQLYVNKGDYVLAKEIMEHMEIVADDWELQEE